jgi:hypothetical protein
MTSAFRSSAPVKKVWTVEVSKKSWKCWMLTAFRRIPRFSNKIILLEVCSKDYLYKVTLQSRKLTGKPSNNPEFIQDETNKAALELVELWCMPRVKQSLDHSGVIPILIRGERSDDQVRGGRARLDVPLTNARRVSSKVPQGRTPGPCLLAERKRSTNARMKEDMGR